MAGWWILLIVVLARSIVTSLLYVAAVRRKIHSKSRLKLTGSPFIRQLNEYNMVLREDETVVSLLSIFRVARRN